MKKILVFGTFDGLHEGHLNFFMQALEYGDYLVVVVGRDENVHKVKNKYPKYNENERLKVIQECKLVNEARLGNPGNDPYKVIKEVMPDVICLGYDQTHFTDKLAQKLKDMGMENVKVERMKPHQPDKFHSSILNK